MWSACVKPILKIMIKLLYKIIFSMDIIDKLYTLKPRRVVEELVYV